jgi:hypothetical protein
MVLHLVAQFLTLVIGFLPRGLAVAAMERVKVECPEGTNNDSENNETAHMVPAKLYGYFGDTFDLLLDLRSKPDRRSLFERRSPTNRRSSSDRVSTPLRRSAPDRRSSLDRLSSLVIAASPFVTQNREGH